MRNTIFLYSARMTLLKYQKIADDLLFGKFKFIYPEAANMNVTKFMIGYDSVSHINLSPIET